MCYSIAHSHLHLFLLAKHHDYQPHKILYNLLGYSHHQRFAELNKPHHNLLLQMYCSIAHSHLHLFLLAKHHDYQPHKILYNLLGYSHHQKFAELNDSRHNLFPRMLYSIAHPHLHLFLLARHHNCQPHKNMPHLQVYIHRQRSTELIQPCH